MWLFIIFVEFSILCSYIYRSAAALYIAGDMLLPEEGTTQGDLLAMPMYALTTIPLIECLHTDVTQV